MTFKELNQKLTSRLLWGNILAMAILTITIIVGTIIFLNIYTHHGETVTMPNVTGQKSEVATRKLEALGLRAEISDTGHITTLPPDIILEQHITAGTKIKQNRLIRLTINSAQAKTLPLPNVVDGSLREAQMKLQAIGFKLGAVKRILGDLNLVYRIEVKGREAHTGDRISIETPITIVVGDGNNEDYYNGDDSAAWASEIQYEHELQELLNSSND